MRMENPDYVRRKVEYNEDTGEETITPAVGERDITVNCDVIKQEGEAIVDRLKRMSCGGAQRDLLYLAHRLGLVRMVIYDAKTRVFVVFGNHGLVKTF